LFLGFTFDVGQPNWTKNWEIKSMVIDVKKDVQYLIISLDSRLFFGGEERFFKYLREFVSDLSAYAPEGNFGHKRRPRGPFFLLIENLNFIRSAVAPLFMPYFF
jgi:hypothetical protein